MPLRGTIPDTGLHHNIKREVLFEDLSGRAKTLQRLDFFSDAQIDFLMRRYLSPKVYYNIKQLTTYDVHNLVYHYYREWMDEHGDVSFIKMNSVCERSYPLLGRGYVVSYRLMVGNNGSIVDTVLAPDNTDIFTGGSNDVNDVIDGFKRKGYTVLHDRSQKKDFLVCGAYYPDGCECTPHHPTLELAKNQNGQWVTSCPMCYAFDCICHQKV